MRLDDGVPSDFGALLRRYRIASGMTQEILADRAGLSVRAIADMERGRTTRPYRQSVRQLADALNLRGEARESLEISARADPDASSYNGYGIDSMAVRTGDGLAASRAARVVPRQLPPVTPYFAGRSGELRALSMSLKQSATLRQTASISVIVGTAGVGKTTLAVYWAHQVADRFPDGQLYANLRGFDSERGPLAADKAISGFLAALGVRSRRLPSAAQGRSGLYRSLLAGSRVLILLDNARDADQVRSLLPGEPACMVVVTSRSQLTGLVAAEGARPLFVDLLSGADAAALLSLRLGAERLAAEPQAADQLIDLCARLPLALAVVAARAAANPGTSLADLCADLRDDRRRLDAMDTGDPATSLRAMFMCCYRLLSDEAAQTFRMVGTCRETSITAAAAASLTGRTTEETRALLRELARYHLVTEYVPDQFRWHDILREFAAERASADRHDARSAS